MVKVNAEKKYRNISPDEKFRFSCHKGLACFGQCCSDVNIFLTPYDVLRMRKALGLPSGEFLKKYTITFLAKQKLSLVLLKMNDDDRKSCPFVGPEGCTIYNDRPWPCRMYPVEVNIAKTDNKSGSEKYYLISEKGSRCLGIKEKKEWTVSEWLKDQGVDSYNKKGKSFKAITSNRLFRSGQGLTDSKAQVFYVALYDLDRFRSLLFDSSFFSRFDIESKVMEKIKVDDEALLDFGVKWLRFSLFGEKTLRIKGEVTEKKARRKGRS